MKKNDSSSIRIKVYFEDPFYVGVFEKQENGKLYVSKVTFGKEPKEKELNAYINENMYRLKWVETEGDFITNEIKNPKRRQREVRKEMLRKGIGTKSQNAIKKQYEENKTVRKKKNKQEKELALDLKYKQKQLKKKEKHKGH